MSKSFDPAAAATPAGQSPGPAPSLAGRAIAVIPARYGSSRLPGKPLELIGPLPMVEHVRRAAVEALGRAVVATDDPRILECVLAYGGEAVLTPADCPNGTVRVARAVDLMADVPPLVVNVQGDEPFTSPAAIRQLALTALAAPCGADVFTMACRVPCGEPWHTLASPGRVKMLLGEPHAPAAPGSPAWHSVLCFSRSVIPCVRDYPPGQWTSHATYYIHAGMYAYTAATLRRVACLSPTPADQAESLEQLRWMAHGYTVGAIVTDTPALAVDTQADLEEARLTFARLSGQ